MNKKRINPLRISNSNTDHNCTRYSHTNNECVRICFHFDLVKDKTYVDIAVHDKEITVTGSSIYNVETLSLLGSHAYQYVRSRSIKKHLMSTIEEARMS